MTALNDQRPTFEHAGTRPGNSSDWQFRYSSWLVVADTAAVVIAVVLAQRVRFGGTTGTNYLAASYSIISIVIATTWLVALSINHSRSHRIIGSGAEEYRRVWLATLTVFGGVAIVSMLFKLEIARGYLMVALPVGAALLIVFRWIARRVIVHLRAKHGRCVTRILLVGSTSGVRDLGVSLAREPWSGFTIVGACISDPAAPSVIEIPDVGSIPVFGGESNVVGAVSATNSHAVAAAVSDRLDGLRIRDLSWALEKVNIDLLVAPGLVDVAGPRLHMRPVAGLPLIHVEKPQYHGAKRFEKRLFDIVFSSTALLCMLPLLLAIAIAIKLTSKGPVIYRQERIGLDGDEFAMIKFRTMVDGADQLVDELAELNESQGGVLFKIRDDPRVTKVGRLLRKYSLDELPQFINVLKSDMSVVGPRPPLAREVRSYDDYARRRLLVRPGITGLWQVSGRSDLSWADSVRLDLFYVENWSMTADLLIALKTIKVILAHPGAY